MTPTSLLAALLLVGGGTVVLLRSQLRRPDVRTRLRRVDGVPAPSRRVLFRAAVAVVVMIAVPAAPVALAVAGAPLVAMLAAVVALPTAATFAAELYASLRRSGMPPRVPFAAGWQRRLAEALVARAVAPYPAPPLRQRRPRRRSARPTLTSAGTGRRLLVLPPGTSPQRLWDVAETYLGARSRYRDILSMNRGRRSPGGAIITEDSNVAAGWTLLMPRDATGAGLVDLPGDPRLPIQPGPAERGFGGVAGASVVLTELEPVPVPEPPPPDEDSDHEPAEATDLASAEVPDHAPVDHPAADLPWDLVHARLLAEGVRAALLFRRGERENRREVGERVRPLDPAAAAVGIAAELGADQRGADGVDRAVRALPAPPPPVVSARLLPDTVEFTLAEPDPAPPAPFTADAGGQRWLLRRGAEPGRDGEPALPGLVSLGRDRTGWTMFDLARAGTTVITGEMRAARMVATAIGLELLTNRWSAGAQVVMVGFGRTFAGLDPRLTVADRLDQVLDGIVRRTREGSAAQFVVLAGPPPAAADELLCRLAGPAVDSRLGVLVVGGATAGRRVLALDADGVLTCAELGIAVGAQALSSATAAALARLIAAETGSEPADPLSRNVVAPELPRDVDPDGTEVVVRLFGDPGLDGPDGPLAADAVTVEIVAFLAVTGIATPREIAQAVFPFGVPEADLGMALKVVVEVLATAPSGGPGLLEYDDGRLELTSDVQTDWHLFVRLADCGRVSDALELLGRAASAQRPAATRGARYGWLLQVALSRTLPGYVADVAHGQVERCLTERRPDLATVAASAGLQAQPFSQVLRDDLQRALHALSERGPGVRGPLP